MLCEKTNNLDTVGLRAIYADSVQYYLGDSLANTYSTNTLINNVLISGVYDGFFLVDKVIEEDGNHVIITTKEFPGYLYKSITEIDTISYMMTYYFKNEKIYKVRIDTLENAVYCYSCLNKKGDKHLFDFYSWLEENHPDIHSILGQQYSEFLEGFEQNPSEVIKSEELQKEYFLRWENEWK